MTAAAATPWDRAHAKSCWARQHQLTDVPQEMRIDFDGTFRTFLELRQERVEIGGRIPLQRSLNVSFVGRFRDRGAFISDGSWLPHGTERYWMYRSAEADSREIRERYTYRRPHANPNTRSDHYGYSPFYGVDYARAEKPRAAPQDVPRHEDDEVPYEHLNPEEKKKRASLYVDRLKQILNRRADAKRR